MFQTTADVKKNTPSKNKNNSSKAFQKKEKKNHWEFLHFDLEYAAYKNTFNKCIKYGTNTSAEKRKRDG